jgi:ERF superfamily
MIEESNQLATVPTPQPSVALMLQTICERGITAENTEAMTQLMKLHERLEDRQAERDFNAAFAALQSETPDIVATSVIPNRGKYERFEDVMHVMRPLLSKHGFSVSFSQETGERITVTCHLRHKSGHSQQTKFGVRLGGKADSETQADCKASTTAKRNSLLQALNIVIRQDCMQDEDDATIVGDVISADQAEALRARVAATGSNEKAFLSFAGASTYAQISQSRYQSLDELLARKEKV